MDWAARGSGAALLGTMEGL